MDASFLGLSLTFFIMACAVTGVAGFVKGMVGFAMPMVMISGLSTFLPAEVALAALIVPTLLTNGVQALRQGVRAAVGSIRRFGLFMGIGLVLLLSSAQLYALLPQQVLFLVIGIPILTFSVLQLIGWRLEVRPEHETRAQVVIGSVAGICGGLSGVWGPPTVAFLTAINTPMAEQMRVQGVIYGLGAVALLAAHIQSGVINAQTLPLSAMMVVPAMAGMLVGMRVQGRLDPAKFRRATLIVLVVAGLNLIRKALMG